MTEHPRILVVDDDVRSRADAVAALRTHGYVVAACDHTGNTLVDVVQFAMMARSGTEIRTPIQ